MQKRSELCAKGNVEEGEQKVPQEAVDKEEGEELEHELSEAREGEGERETVVHFCSCDCIAVYIAATSPTNIIPACIAAARVSGVGWPPAAQTRSSYGNSPSG